MAILKIFETLFIFAGFFFQIPRSKIILISNFFPTYAPYQYLTHYGLAFVQLKRGSNCKNMVDL